MLNEINMNEPRRTTATFCINGIERAKRQTGVEFLVRVKNEYTSFIEFKHGINPLCELGHCTAWELNFNVFTSMKYSNICILSHKNGFIINRLEPYYVPNYPSSKAVYFSNKIGRNQ